MHKNLPHTALPQRNACMLRPFNLLAAAVMAASLASGGPVAAAIISNASSANFTGPEFSLFNGIELQSFTDGTSSDSPANFTSTINWGDGTTSAGDISGDPSNFAVTGSHTYADEGNYVFQVTTTILGDGVFATGASAIVTEADALSGTGNNITFTAGVPLANLVMASFSDTTALNTVGDFAATIDWGDGTQIAATVTGSAGAYQVLGSHTYAADGLYNTSVSLSDLDGTASATVRAFASSQSLPSSTPVPEPAMPALFGLGLAGIAALRRKR